jgi:AraC-like DNA-binding protein
MLKQGNKKQGEGSDAMEDQNICRFLPVQNHYDAIHTINFVLETKRQVYEGLVGLTVFRMHYVLQGEGVLHTPGKTRALRKGDLFFGLPAVPMAIESGEEFRYLYISFLGGRANMIMDRLQIGSQNTIFHGYEELEDYWLRSVNAVTPMMDLCSESVLLYTFSVMAGRMQEKEEVVPRSGNTVLQIKKYLDDNYADTELTLEKIGGELSYNRKYLSTAFKKEFRIGITEYLNTIRVQHACTMLEQGFTSMKDIAQLCGYRDPLYFSRIFKKYMGVSPREHMRSLEEKKQKSFHEEIRKELDGTPGFDTIDSGKY